MSAVLDHIGAILMAGGAILLGATLLLLRSDATTDDTRTYALQQSQDAFIAQVQWDLDNVGVGTPVGKAHIEPLAANRFAFYGVVDAVGTTGLVEYVRLPGETVGEKVYDRIERRVNGVASGGSGGRISRFEVHLLDAQGQRLTAPPIEIVRAVEVVVEWAAPFAIPQGASKRQAVPRASWSTVVYPLGLRP